ncbi:hypothetical protein PGB90_009236 [Kerria lacca]
MADDEAKRAKQAEIDRKRAEVRKRMEEASKAKKAKKGFMTPDRKKKLRLLLRKKAAEELKKEQERKAAERRRIIEERCGHPKNIDDANEDLLKRIIKDYYDRINRLEDQKFDLEYAVKKKDSEVSVVLNVKLTKKLVKPTLKKVSKYENKFAKLQKKAAEFNFRNQLKVVKKKEFTLEEEDKEKKPDWSKKGDEKKGESEAEDENESVATEGEGLITAESEGGLTDAESKSEATLSEVERATPEPDLVVEEPPIAEEIQPPSPAPEELWVYLKEAVTSDAVVSVDELVEKLVSTVSTIPQPYLKSVVKESIKKQKSIEEEESAAHVEGEGQIADEEKPEQCSTVEEQTAKDTLVAEETQIVENSALAEDVLLTKETVETQPLNEGATANEEVVGEPNVNMEESSRKFFFLIVRKQKARRSNYLFYKIRQ